MLLLAGLAPAAAAAAPPDAAGVVPAAPAGPPPPTVVGPTPPAGFPPPAVVGATGTASARPKPARPVPAAAGRAPQITLYTLGPGDEAVEKFGHATLCLRYVDDPRRPTVCYDYGTASFDRPFKLAWGFVRGAGEFWVSTDYERVMLARYTQDDRTIWRQDLPLTDEQARRIEHRLHEDTADPAWRYPYQIYQDNCSTRLRDLVDLATAGAFRARTAREPEPSGRTFRELGEGPLAEHPAVVAFLELTLARAADVPVSRWESMFRPDRLRLEVERFFGVPAVLVRQREGREFQLELGWGATPYFLFLAVLFAVPLAVARRQGRGERLALGVMLGPLVLLSVVIWFLTWVTRIPEGHYNELMAVFLPLDLALAFLDEPRRRLYARIRVAELALVSLLLAVGVLRQPMWIPLLMVFAPFAVLAFVDRREPAAAPVAAPAEALPPAEPIAPAPETPADAGPPAEPAAPAPDADAAPAPVAEGPPTARDP